MIEDFGLESDIIRFGFGKDCFGCKECVGASKSCLRVSEARVAQIR